MKVIFLDFDGVLVTQTSLRRSVESGKMLEECAEKSCIENLNKIITQTEAKIVVSSSWRIAGPKEMVRRLETWGVVGECIGITPDLWQQKRGAEISRWLSKREDVESFVIIDDDDDMEDLIHRLVQTEFQTGLLDEHADRCIRMLLNDSR